MYNASKDRYTRARENLATEIANSYRIKDRNLLEALKNVPRHLFVPKSLLNRAYDDDALPIGAGQTISKPSIIARMIQAAGLDPRKTVLEIGTGSGYQAALLAFMTRHVYTLERIDSLTREASARLKQLGFQNISVKTFDGTYGWSERGPFDAIIIAAAAPQIPENLISQLKPGGIMVCPVGDGETQILYAVQNNGKSASVRELGDCRFVPLIGKYGWKK